MSENNNNDDAGQGAPRAASDDTGPERVIDLSTWEAGEWIDPSTFDDERVPEDVNDTTPTIWICQCDKANHVGRDATRCHDTTCPHPPRAFMNLYSMWLRDLGTLGNPATELEDWSVHPSNYPEYGNPDDEVDDGYETEDPSQRSEHSSSSEEQDPEVAERQEKWRAHCDEVGTNWPTDHGEPTL